MQWSIGKKLGAGFGITLFLFSIVAYFSYQNISDTFEYTNQVQHAREVLAQLDELRALVQDAEAGQRGYILTGDPEYLDSYTTAIGAIEQVTQTLRQLIADNLDQQRQLDTLEPLIANRLVSLQKAIDARRDQGFDAAVAIVQLGEGKRIMDSVRTMIRQMENEEQRILEQRIARRTTSVQATLALVGYGTGLTVLVAFLIGFWTTRSLTRAIGALTVGAQHIGSGQLEHRVVVQTKDELGTLAGAFNRMAEQLQEVRAATRAAEQQTADENWLKTNLAKFAALLQGQRDLRTLAALIMSELPPLVSCQHGAFYILESEDSAPALQLLAGYAYVRRKNLSNRFSLGEGLVGQCALEKKPILLTNVPADYVQITSGLGEAPPQNIIVLPAVFEGQVLAVIELASFQHFRSLQQTFLEQLMENLGVVLNMVRSNMRTEELLQQAQAQAEELQSQQEELRQTNEELEEKTRLLVEQNIEVARKNQEIEQARRALQEKAEQLALTSKYKSEFLASMSHELRTPLNSLLILSQQLSENPEGNLTAQQVEFARTIHGSGTDLLHLINDILDLSKIESGTVTVTVEHLTFADLRSQIERTFRHVAEAKGLRFSVELAPNLPRGVETDVNRLQQVLRNLLANAFKFTEQGSVTLRIASETGGWSPVHDVLNRATTVIGFAVSDTGIGIPLDKQRLIFEAFQQADTGTSRKYGGTGLGLAICREIAALLGGEIRLTSTPGQGSTFTFYLPQPYQGPATLVSPEALSESLRTRSHQSDLSSPTAALEATTAPVRLPTGTPLVTSTEDIPDDRNQIREDDQVLLIVEDDPRFARILLDMAHARGFKGIYASQGAAALTLARDFTPAAITLDLHLPDMDGWAVLDHLKRDPATQSIPVHIISVEEDRLHGLERGAFAYLTKPVTREALEEAFAKMQAFSRPRVKKLLVVEDDESDRQTILETIGNGDVEVTTVSNGTAALAALRAEHFDCMVLDLRLPDISGFQVLEELRKDPRLRDLPVVVNTGKELTPAEEGQLREMAKSIIVKGARSPERLLAETALFLHRVVAHLPAPKRRMLEQLYQSDTALTGKQVLIVDDDVRNIFALTSALERHQMVIHSAENGQEAIERLQTTPGIDIVLMDIMMPDMDGYDTMRAIRALPPFKSLPIIALTAKAMKGDREKCLEAGASDYITKPVNIEQLLSLLRVWLYR